MADDIPGWAWDALRKRSGLGPSYKLTGTAEFAFWQNLARYIAEHEEPPVDPLLFEARELVKATLTPEEHKRCNCRAEIDAGGWDTGQKVRVALAALKRGMELAHRDRPQ